MPDVSTVFVVVDLVGVVVNGIIGGSVARDRHFDVVGFMLLAIVSALGGGILRDVILNTRPLAVQGSHYLVFALIGAAAAYVLRLEGRWWGVVMPFLDSLALGTWAASGASRSLQFGVHGLPVLFLGLATAIGGGTIRDVAVGDVPAVFGGNRLYAIPALLDAATVLLLHHAGASSNQALVTGTAVGFLLAWGAHLFGWSVPQHGDGTLTEVRDRVLSVGRDARRDDGALDGRDAPERRLRRR